MPTRPSHRGLSIALLTGACLAGIAPPAGAQDASGGDPRAVATRVHEEGGYPDDVLVLDPALGELAGGGSDADGAGRGPRGETSVDGDRDATSPPPAFSLPWLDDLLRWLGSLLSSFAGPLGYAVLAIGLAIIVLIVAFFLASLRFRVPRIEARTRGEEAGASIDPLLVGTGESADALAAEGRWREAIHALFLDALGRVGGSEGRLRSRTARELVHSVDPQRRGRAELGALLDLTERVWFGGRPATEAQYREARALIDAVPPRTDEEMRAEDEEAA